MVPVAETTVQGCVPGTLPVHCNQLKLLYKAVKPVAGRYTLSVGTFCNQLVKQVYKAV